MRQLYADEVEMTFESNGVPVIAQEVVCRFYIPAGNITLYEKGIWRQYELNSLIQRLNARGRELYKDDSVIRKARSDFREYGKTLHQTCAEIAASKVPQLADFKRLIEEAGRYMREYEYFDAWYTDGVYPLRGDPGVASALKYAEREKNGMREEFSAMFYEKGKEFQGVLERIAVHLGIEQGDIMWYFIEDIEAAFNGVIQTREQNEARRRAYVYLIDEDTKTAALDGEEAITYIRKFESKNESNDTRELRGQTANRGQGIVRGVARIINSDYVNFSTTQAAMDAMNEGDILIAPTTAPDLLPAMKKAAAIVTDIGGMLSHAALTSRELGKPCIVGTRIASRVFKDGNMVEVDVDSEIVRKI